MSDHIVYFAYGSNMSTPRLRYRVAGAEPIGIGRLAGHRLRFHKRSDKDGSGKCDAELTGESADEVIGVLFRVPKSQLKDLHAAEGRGYGYADHIVQVTSVDGATIEAMTYRAAATHRDSSLSPFTWYWDFVADGAREHGLPPEYVAAHIAGVDRHQDPDAKRAADERAKVARGDKL